ncbi:hypothetical protein EYF80_045445 [Liparis tanakae]|uniref:Uncharacterized protein n=1 Tax=Liparis tanakae TaxID=230148 RepID=A0A4Z2FT68_9TELE|nr:hypothetical protein EYF80_045445 [Liparis tanakae]
MQLTWRNCDDTPRDGCVNALDADAEPYRREAGRPALRHTRVRGVTERRGCSAFLREGKSAEPAAHEPPPVAD